MKKMTHIRTNWMSYKTCKHKYRYTNDFPFLLYFISDDFIIPEEHSP